MQVPEKPSLDGLEAKWGEWWEASGTYRFATLGSAMEGEEDAGAALAAGAGVGAIG